MSEPRREVAAMLPYSILRYVEHTLGRAEADAVRVAAGETKSLEEMTERGAWCSTSATVAIAEHARRVTGTADVGRPAGEELFRLHEETGITGFIAAEGSTEAALDMVINYSSRMSTGRVMRITERYDAAFLVEGVYQGAMPAGDLFCNFALGYWAQVPTLFGGRGYAVELECQSRGDARCLSRISWSARADLEDEVDTDGAVERRDQMLIAYEDLQQMAAELLQASDIGSMLDLAVQRAETAVLAPRFLLAVFVGSEDEPRVHHRGFRTDSQARGAATALLAGEVPPGTVVADICSAQGGVGKIAAIYPKGAAPLKHDERLMTAYAGHIAAALESRTAAERARNDRDTAQALLDLSHALARVGTSREVADRLALVLPAVAGSDSASVWLWDPTTLEFGVAAISPSLNSNEMPPVLNIQDIDAMAKYVASPRPMIIDAHRTTGALQSAMAVRGVRLAAVVPVIARGELLALVAAGFRDLISDERREILLRRLGAVADQAATALDNARLLDQVRHQALHDPLTGLPNRALIQDRAEHAVRGAARTGRAAALLFLDLDGFKVVNDRQGHHVGDELLRCVVERLQQVTRSCDTLARLGGDEFLVLLSEVADPPDAVRIAERMLGVFRAPFSIEGGDVRVTCSVGVAVTLAAGSDYATLLQSADAAMYEAKAMGGNTLAVHADYIAVQTLPAPAL